MRIEAMIAGFIFFQATGRSQSAEDVIERLAGYPGQVEGETVDLEEIEWLLDHPLDLNRASAEDLRQIPGISAEESLRIVEYRSDAGRFESIEQLREVPGIPPGSAEWLRPFLSVSKPAPDRRRTPVFDLRVRSNRSLEIRRGYETGTYPGSPDKGYLRVNGHLSEHFEAGLLGEKDPGEKLRNGFASGFIAFTGQGIVQKAVIGDFRVRSGQGLAIWIGSGFGKGGDPVGSVRKSAGGILPSRSSDEVNFLRGGGLTLRRQVGGGDLLLTGFYSSQLIPASEPDGDEGISFYEAGLFRTDSEVEKLNRFREKIVGGIIRFVMDGTLSVGFSTQRAVYELRNGPDQLRAPFSMITCAGIDAAYHLGQSEIFCETATAAGGRIRWILGTRIDSESHRLAVLYRSYPRDAMTARVSGFGEHDRTENERGFYIGFRLRPSSTFWISGFADLFSFPDGTFSLPVGSGGYELSIEPSWKWQNGLQCSIRYQRKLTSSDIPSTDSFDRDIDILGDRHQHRIRLSVQKSVSRVVTFSGRLEWTELSYHPERSSGESGVLISQEVRVGPWNGVSVQGRINFFYTDSYDSRIYQFENDVRGSFQVPAFFRKGSRWYLLLRYDLFGFGEISMKYSLTRRDGEVSIGTGDDEIAGDAESELSLQLDLRL